MILLELELENFKQFRGKHIFNPTPSGVVGIIGTNGAGKTTLFEAIEWCLYQPREIRSDEIPPRGDDGGRPRVRLRLANPHTGATFEIERILKKTAATAEIVEIGPEGERTVLATGSTTVSGYTASRLIGLEHKAFVATFFTRQKELSFFGALKPTDRRREVGRLLGLETIRTAQEKIAEERTAKRNVSSALLSQYDHESGQRDFAAEKAAAFQRLSEIDVQIAEQSAALIAAEAEYRDASNQRSALVEKREAALRVKSERDQCDLKLRQAESAIEAAKRELQRISDIEKERPSLLELANRVEAIGSEVLRLETAKEQSDRLASLVQQRKQIAQDQIRTRESVQAAIRVGFAAWESRSLREEDDLSWIEHLLRSAQSVDARATEVRLNGLTRLQEVQASVRTADQNLDRYQTGIRQLQDKVTELLGEGDPDVRERSVSEVRDEAQRTNVTHLASIGALRTALADLTQITRHDHANLDGTVCPTCLRTFTQEDLEQSRVQLERRADEHRAQIAKLEAESSRLQARMAACDADLKAIRQIRDELLTLRERIINGEKTVADVRSNRDLLLATQGELASTHSHPEIVTDDELVELERKLGVERSVETARAVLDQARGSLKQLAARDAELAGAIDSMGPVQFDPAQLSQARADQDKARSAIERLRYLDQMQERAPEHHQTIATATSERDSASADIVRLDELLVDAPLDNAFLDRADMNLDRCRQNVQTVQSRIEFQRRARQDVDRDLTQIDTDEKKLGAIALRAEAARVESDDLDRMYKEFNAFEQYVARRVRPQLEDMTSELVRVITENKYESVELDDDYGIKVWDGDVGNYPIEHFSGGERDVIALSARLALSRLIGSQAANPPSFMVLDEVFGSLDRDRRANVLDLLSSLAGSAESFQQLFVISHVDDVRLSPAFNEVWRVAERDDGSSRLENLNLTQGAEDL